MPPQESTTRHHAEYKVPGGKLVVIDLDVHSGHISNVRLSGDFFLEPPEALDALNQALETLPTETPDDVIVQRLDAALGDDAQMFGFSAEAIVVVLRRALA